MPAPDPDQRRLARVLTIARVDGWSLIAVAGPAGLVSLFSRDLPSTLTAAGVTLCGLLELRGHARLRRREVSGLRWLIAAQLSCLLFILGYVAVIVRAASADHLLSLLPAFSKAQLEFLFPDPAELRFWFAILTQLSAWLLAGLTLLYQGGLALYYARTRVAALRSFANPPVLP